MALYCFEVTRYETDERVGRIFAAGGSMQSAAQLANRWASRQGYELVEPRNVPEIGTPAPRGAIWFTPASP